ncbi:hypothetical protein ABPG74_007836 [Tetrahymena malaccensis]
MRKITSVLILISIALFTVNASKCEDDLKAQMTNGTVCQQTDTACQNALGTLYTCFASCATNNTADSAIVSCVKTNCSNNSNATVQAFYNKIIACFDSVLLFSVIFIFIALLF